MILRRAAPGFSKPLANLPLLTLIVAATVAVPHLLARAEPATDGIAKAIERVALQHHLVSSETRLVAIDPAKSRPDGEVVTSTDVPLNLPGGWVYDKVFGRSTAGGLQAAPSPRQIYGFDQAATPQAAASNLSAMMDMAAEEAPAPLADASTDLVGDADVEAPKPQVTGVTQSQTTVSEVSGAAPSTSNGQKRQIGMFVLLLTTLSAVMLLLWRHSRRDYASPRRIGRRI
jgi:hypothetical protein